MNRFMRWVRRQQYKNTQANTMFELILVLGFVTRFMHPEQRLDVLEKFIQKRWEKLSMLRREGWGIEKWLEDYAV